MTEFFLSLGTNMGNRLANLEQAIELICQFSQLIKRSSIYESSPLGEIEQNNFLNMILHLKTRYSAHELLEKALASENKMGRVRKEKWGPRLIDIDIIAYGNEVFKDKGLQIPHPEFAKRRFVLEPFCEVAPDFRIDEKTIADYLKDCPDQSQIQRIQEEFVIGEKVR